MKGKNWEELQRLAAAKKAQDDQAKWEKLQQLAQMKKTEKQPAKAVPVQGSSVIAPELMKQINNSRRLILRYIRSELSLPQIAKYAHGKTNDVNITEASEILYNMQKRALEIFRINIDAAEEAHGKEATSHLRNELITLNVLHEMNQPDDMKDRLTISIRLQSLNDLMSKYHLSEEAAPLQKTMKDKLDVIYKKFQTDYFNFTDLSKQLDAFESQLTAVHNKNLELINPKIKLLDGAIKQYGSPDKFQENFDLIKKQMGQGFPDDKINSSINLLFREMALHKKIERLLPAAFDKMDTVKQFIKSNESKLNSGQVKKFEKLESEILDLAADNRASPERLSNLNKLISGLNAISTELQTGHAKPLQWTQDGSNRKQEPPEIPDSEAKIKPN